MSPVKLIEVIIGLVFVVLLLSIIVSLLNEIIVTNIKIRSRLLKKSISRLLDDPNSSHLLSDHFYNHPLVSKLTKRKKSIPSYISPSTFSKVLVDILQENRENKQSLKESINNLPENSETKIALLTLLNDSVNNETSFKLNIEEWFNESMSRLSGWYKRYSQIQLFVIGLILAILLNVNIIHIAKELTDDKEKRIQIAAAAIKYTKSKKQHAENKEVTTKNDNLLAEKLLIKSIQPKNHEQEIIPHEHKITSYEREIEDITSTITDYSGLVGIFWNGEVRGIGDLYRKLRYDLHLSAVLGWLIAALAASLGSSFWFDLLKKIVNVRGSVKPEANK